MSITILLKSKRYDVQALQHYTRARRYWNMETIINIGMPLHQYEVHGLRIAT